MTDPVVDIHNQLAGEIVGLIIKPILTSGGTWTDVMVLTESILVGICLAGVKLGGDEKMLDIMTRNVRKRMAEIRLTDIEPMGSA